MQTLLSVFRFVDISLEAKNTLSVDERCLIRECKDKLATQVCLMHALASKQLTFLPVKREREREKGGTDNNNEDDDDDDNDMKATDIYTSEQWQESSRSG